LGQKEGRISTQEVYFIIGFIATIGKKRGLEKLYSCSDTDTEIFVASSDIFDHVSKLKFYVGGEPDCMDLWKLTYDYRKYLISQSITFQEVADEFPLCKQATVYTFVSTMPNVGL